MTKVTAWTNEPTGAAVEFCNRVRISFKQQLSSRNDKNTTFDKAKTQSDKRKMYLPPRFFYTVRAMPTLFLKTKGDSGRGTTRQDTAGLSTENRWLWLTEKREFATHKDNRNKTTFQPPPRPVTGSLL